MAPKHHRPAAKSDSERNREAAIAAGILIVPAVGVAVGQHLGSAARAAAIEAAMVKAIEDAHAEGITDQDEIRARMLAAREGVA